MFPPPWFFGSFEDATERVVLLAEEAHHARDVLRLSVGDGITVTDGAGKVARCEVLDIAEEVRGVIREVRVEPRIRPSVIVYQGEAKGGKLDSVVERLAELGVVELWSFSSERSVVRWDDLKKARLERRWKEVARSAAKQSRNPYVLEPHAGLSWEQLRARVKDEPFGLTLWEEATIPLRAALGPATDRVALIVGPEGGLTREEAEDLADAGAPMVSLGPRILRTENAGVVAASALLFHAGLIG